MMPCDALSGLDEAPTMAIVVASVSSVRVSSVVGLRWAIERLYVEGLRSLHAVRLLPAHHAAGDTAWVVAPGASGVMNHAAKYAMTPMMIPPGTTDRTAHNTRTTVESTSRYSAIPPQTP